MWRVFWITSPNQKKQHRPRGIAPSVIKEPSWLYFWSEDRSQGHGLFWQLRRVWNLRFILSIMTCTVRYTRSAIIISVRVDIHHVPMFLIVNYYISPPVLTRTLTILHTYVTRLFCVALVKLFFQRLVSLSVCLSLCASFIKVTNGWRFRTAVSSVFPRFVAFHLALHRQAHTLCSPCRSFYVYILYLVALFAGHNMRAVQVSFPIRRVDKEIHEHWRLRSLDA